MTLTPQDVASKEFLTVRLREGYDMQEVDEFLDQVEAELRRLNDENERLRAGVETTATSGAVAEAPSTSDTDLDTARAAAEEARITDTGIQKAVSDPAEAPAAALTILTHAQTAADNLVDEAQSRADQLVTDATAKADSLVNEATERAETLDAETQRREDELMGELKAREAELRTRLEDLRAHEREYRSRLVAYHSEQVRRLQEGQADDTDVEAPASSAEHGEHAESQLGEHSTTEEADSGGTQAD